MIFFWSHYIKNSSSINFSLKIPINEENYIQKILKFDSWFFEKGAQFGMYNFIETEKINRGETQKYINEYVSSREKRMFKRDAEFITLGGVFNWDYSLNLVKTQGTFHTINIPIFENGQWQYQSVNPFGILERESDVLYDDDLHDFKKNKIWNNIVEIVFFSSSNIWYDEIEYTQLEEYLTFSPPVDNRPVAYRISPRFNSFLRELKTMTYSLEGEFILHTHSEKLSAEGYILLDGQVVFQEDIDSGKVKIPD